MIHVSLAIAVSQVILSVTHLILGEPVAALSMLVGGFGWLLFFIHERKRFSNEPPF